MGNNEQIKLVFNSSTLETLISEGHLRATDFSCLDAKAKTSVWQILGSITARSLRLS